jgi:hypothetical protein
MATLPMSCYTPVQSFRHFVHINVGSNDWMELPITHELQQFLGHEMAQTNHYHVLDIEQVHLLLADKTQTVPAFQQLGVIIFWSKCGKKLLYWHCQELLPVRHCALHNRLS